MPFSRPNLKAEMMSYFVAQFPDRETEILDVGAGAGDIGKRLRASGYDNVDAVEIWQPWLDKYGLAKIYRDVVVSDVMALHHIANWKVAMLGDVLEHLDVRDAAMILGRFWRFGIHCYVIVPWTLEQGSWGGNPYEEHKQADLTPEVMAERYPRLQLLKKDKLKGLYEMKRDVYLV